MNLPVVRCFCAVVACTVFSVAGYSQLVMTNGTTIYVDQGTVANPTYVVLNTPPAVPIQTIGPGNGIILESEYNILKYNLHAGTTAITVPYMTPGPALESFPLKVHAITAGIEAGSAGTIQFSSTKAPARPTGWDNLSYKPSDVLNMQGPCGVPDNSAKVIDRFWVIDPLGYSTKPAVTLDFTFLNAEESVNSGNTINPANLQAEYWNSALGTPAWIVSAPPGITTVNSPSPTQGTVNSVVVTPVNFFRSWTLVDNPLPLSITPSQTNVSCNGSNTGSAIAGVSGGTVTYTYSWTPSGGSSSIASGLGAGVYTCTIQDAAGCSTSQVYTISQPGILNITPSQTNATCNASATGTATSSVSGGTGVYTYSWTGGIIGGGQGTATATGLSAGTYSCTVNDANNCSTTQTFTITEPSAIALTPSSTQTGCGVSTGTASVTVSGGTGAYTYSWTPAPGTGQNTANAGALGAGSFTVSVTDAQACVQTSVFNITSAGAPVPTLNSSANLTCNSACNGTATVSATGGTTPYTYSWTGGGGTNSTASSLCAATYSCTITDANNCSVVQTVTITQPGALNIVPASVNPACNGSSTGSATATVSGGTGIYTYSWTGGVIGGGQNTFSATGLASGTYTCTIQDANNCSTSQTFTITDPAAMVLTPSSTQTACTLATGTASVTVAGGTGPFTYSWAPNPGGGQNTANATGLPVGSWTVDVTDSKACVQNSIFNITAAGAPVTSIASSTNIVCNSACTGSATVSATGGVAPYTYSWSGGGGSGITANSLCAATYNCTITDANHCSSIQSVVITQPAALAITPAQTNIACNGSSNGSATANVSGGTGSYTYSWTPAGGIAPTASGLGAGTYTCTITDGSACTASQIYTITQPAILSSASTLNGATCNLGNGSATAIPSGGSGTYTYSWLPSGGNSAIANNLNPGNYTCTIIDSLGCTTSVTVSITNTGSKPVASINPGVATSFCQGTSALLTASGGGTYSWSNGGLTSAININTAGTYTVYVTNGCGTDSAKVVATVNPLPVPIISAGSGTFCAGDSAILLASGGTSYSWSNGVLLPSQYVTTPGVYTVTATNACGSASTTVNVTSTSIAAHFSQSIDTGQYPLPVIFTDHSTAGATSWIWNFGNLGTSIIQNPSFTFPQAGTYTITETVTNANGCTSTTTSEVVVTDNNSWIIVPNIFTPNGDGTNDGFQVLSAGISTFDAQIYDRWGVSIAELTSVNAIWDGRTISGQEVSNGTYFYIINAVGFDKKVYHLQGFVQLMR